MAAMNDYGVWFLRPAAAKNRAMRGPSEGAWQPVSYRCDCAGSHGQGAHHGWPFPETKECFGGILFMMPGMNDSIQLRPDSPARVRAVLITGPVRD